jgi:tRNA-uridine 2-sulfurtransferase
MMLKLWTEDCDQQENACCTPESIAQARAVAGQLKIPFYVLDAKEDFKQKVVDAFIAGYQNGLTPNPCFVCNQTIKWGFLLEKAIQAGADWLATGHYAQILNDNSGFYHLQKSQDEKKDQSYVLAGLSQEQLSHTILPLGTYRKTEVRDLARKFGLLVADKADSQDLCFIDKKGYRAFIESNSSIKSRSGIMRNILGEAIGEHQGLVNYTIGQRKGLGSGSPIPLYVIKKDLEKNELIVGPGDQLGTNIMLVDLIQWNPYALINNCKTYEIKIRYKSTPRTCTVEKINSKTIKIKLGDLVRDATPGQIAVLYNENEVVGSGIILSAERE